MLKFPRTRILVIAMVIFAVLGASPLGVTRSVLSAPPLPKLQGSFDGWSYLGAVDSDGYINAYVRLESNTVSGLKNYAAANRLLADQLWQSGQQTMQVDVILKHPLSIEAVSRLRARTGVTVHSIDGRIVGADGQRAGVEWIVNDQSDLTSSILDRAQSDISQKSGQANFLGVTNFRGTVDRKGYYQLVAEPEVFMVDVTVNQIRRDVGNNLPIEKFSMVSAPNVFWSMEDLGLSNFQ